jgi:hypothetical protein
MRIGDPNERMTRATGCVAVPVPFAIETNKIVVRAQAITDGAKAITDTASSAKGSRSSNTVAE